MILRASKEKGRRGAAQRFILYALPELFGGGPCLTSLCAAAWAAGYFHVLLLAALLVRVACEVREVTAGERLVFWRTFDYAMACPKTVECETLLVEGSAARRRIVMMTPHDPYCVGIFYSLPRYTRLRGALFVDNTLAAYSPGIRALTGLLGFSDVVGLTNEKVNAFLAGRTADVVVLPGGFREAAACSRDVTRISFERWLFWARKAIKFRCDLALRVVEGATQTVEQTDALWRCRHCFAAVGCFCAEWQGVSVDIRPMTVYGFVERYEDIALLDAEAVVARLQTRLKNEILSRFREEAEVI